jgi:outer membrane protein assembly factor BamA
VAMKKISGNFSGGMGYDFDYHWNVKADTLPSGDSTDMEKYGFNKTSSSSGITLNLQYDSRLNSNNPSKGMYAFLELRSNLKALGSNDNWQSLLLDVRKYIPLSKKSGNVLALWSYNWITVKGDIPYFDLPSLGWDHYNNMGRGYVQGRFRGWNMLYAEAEYRFRLTKNGFLGGVLFTNASSLTEYPSNKWEKINPGGGLGLRIKMNKLSNTNFAVDYGFGVNGSRGFSFNLNEVF